MFQKLSEDFIREFQDKVYWYNISTYQKLSESFIRDFQDKVNWYFISKHQKLSNEFIDEFKDRLNLNRIKDSWHYKTTEEKKQVVIDTGLYECHDTYFIAYKGIEQGVKGLQLLYHPSLLMSLLPPRELEVPSSIFSTLGSSQVLPTLLLQKNTKLLSTLPLEVLIHPKALT